MEYVELGGQPGPHFRLSRLILGTDHLGNMPDRQTREILDEAVRLGINAFDTAPIYTDSIEIRLGAWLASRDSAGLHVITKGGFPRDIGPGTYSSRLEGPKAQLAANVLWELQKSRAKFERPFAVYLMHRDDADFRDYRRLDRPQTPVRTILEALADPLLRKHHGLLGVSNWETSRVEEAQRVAAESPELPRPVCNSPYFSLLEMGPVPIHCGGVQVTHEQMLDPEFQRGVKLMTYSPLGGFSIFSRGWAAAKRHALELKREHDRYWGHVHDAIFHEANARRYERALEFTRTFNARNGTAFTADQVANAYVLAHPRSDFLLIGPRSIEQLHRTVRALELSKRLTPADLDFLHGDRSARGPELPEDAWRGTLWEC